jgi:hypothetical protein
MAFSVLIIIFAEQRLTEHIQDSIKRREPGIAALATKYNNLCDEMGVLIRKGQAPRFAVVPKKLERDSLFDLDVDEDIWQDVGLNDDGGIEPPPWMADDKVRMGIRSMLELDRCEEELSRLRLNRSALQEWFVDEWETVMSVMEVTGM